MNCHICERGCEIPEGGSGACGMYSNREGKIVELFPHKYLITTPISIETMPLLHFFPGGKFLQISTVGCNFDCAGCISTVIVREMAPGSKALRELSPEEVVKKALENGCIGIAFLMNDPLASFLTFTEVAKTAKEHGLLVGCSSNAYFTETSLDELTPYLDFINVGVKGLSKQAYPACGGSTPAPVLRNIKRIFEKGVHVEVSCIHYNDNREEILVLARRLADISTDIPLQVMRFIPLESAEPSLEPTIRETENLYASLIEQLNHVYIFNSPGTRYLSTLCRECGTVIYRRDFYGPMGAKLRPGGTGLGENNNCPRCGRSHSFKGTEAIMDYQEGDFQGGYPFTRALEMVEAILIAMGVNDKNRLVRSWEKFLNDDSLQKLHRDLQNPETYIGLIRHFGQLLQLENKAEDLAAYMEGKIAFIKEGLSAASHKPRVYYAMGKPNFCIKGGRLENQLIEAAGGINVNKEVNGSGRPGMSITYDELGSLNPEVIFISSFISSTVEDFYLELLKAGLDVDAVRNQKIYNHPSPCWDFGSPRWILGLMHIANVLHPEIFHFDLIDEAAIFYRRFYNMDFNISEVNRSFGKPSSNFKWANKPGGTAWSRDSIDFK